MGLSLGKLLDPGALVHEAVDFVLPKDMHWVGGLVGAAVDLECGNEAGAVKQGLSALSDLADVAQNALAHRPANDPATNNPATNNPATNQTKGGWRGASQNWSYEPSPPPARVTTTTTTTTVTTTTTPTAVPPTPPRGGTAPPPTTSAPASTAPTSSLWAVGQRLAASLGATSPTGINFRGSPPQSASAPASSTRPATSAGTSAPTPASASAPDKPSNVDASKLSKDQFLGLSDDDLMKAVRDGKIPKEVTDSQGGMLALQARMDHISEMNKMMTSMMQAMHQMNMSVVENLRA